MSKNGRSINEQAKCPTKKGLNYHRLTVFVNLPKVYRHPLVFGLQKWTIPVYIEMTAHFLDLGPISFFRPEPVLKSSGKHLMMSSTNKHQVEHLSDLWLCLRILNKILKCRLGGHNSKWSDTECHEVFHQTFSDFPYIF